MSKRLVKQIFIFFVFIFVLSIIAFTVYYIFKPAPSCFDGVLNQNEEGIDCGGLCLSCEMVYPENIDVLWSGAVLAQGNFYDVAVKIKNQNQNSGSGYIPYKLELYNRYDELTGERSGRTFILPNQAKYIIELKVESFDIVKDIKVSFGDIEWQKLPGRTPQVAVIQKEYNQLEGKSQVRGVVLNEAEIDFDNVGINILLFDSLHNLVGLNVAEIENLPAGQKRDFTAVWFKELQGSVAFIESEAETNIYVQSF